MMAVLRYFTLAHDTARFGVGKFAREAPDGTVVTFSEPKRNSAINAALHAKLTEIAKGHKWSGQRLSVETWKRLFTAAWCRATGQAVVLLQALDGAGVDIVFRRTSDMTQEEVSSLLSYIEAWEAEAEPVLTPNVRAKGAPSGADTP